MIIPESRGEILFKQDFVSFTHIDTSYIDAAIQNIVHIDEVPGKESYDTAPVMSHEFAIVSWQLSQCLRGAYIGNLENSRINALASEDVTTIKFRLRGARETVLFAYSQQDDALSWHAEYQPTAIPKTDDELQTVMPFYVRNETAVRALRIVKMSIKNVPNSVKWPGQEISAQSQDPDVSTQSAS